jgi:hypothetical protein
VAQRGFSWGIARFQAGALLPDHVHQVSESVTVIEGTPRVLIEGRAYLFGSARLRACFRFAPRIRDLKEKRLYLLPGTPVLASMMAGTINIRVISDHWFELLRLAVSTKTGTVTASVILRKLAAYPRQNGLALALRELGKVGTDSIYAPMAAGPRTAPS